MTTATDELRAQREYARDELSAALGVPNLWKARRAVRGALEPY